ncbi:MAG: hypothetical protein JXA78_06660 [Anaerolineales bacterium]|nr:hypothetical protein [Anaerolineales bacterium]
MSTVTYSMGEDYWETFAIEPEDIEFLYNYLLEIETPLTSQELLAALVDERIRRQRLEIERQRTSGGELYQPKKSFSVNQKLIFPALGWKRGEVIGVREGKNPDLGEFQVIQIAFGDGSQREFAAGLAHHKLNAPPRIVDDLNYLDKQTVMKIYFNDLLGALEEDLETNSDFVRIAGRWFPRALLIDINVGHLNLAEAVLDMAGGGPLSTSDLLEQIEIDADVNPKLTEFSLDLTLQEDERFDEVGPAGDVLWFLRRLEPPQMLEPPMFLRYHEVDYDRSIMTDEMLTLERELDDELSPPNSVSRPLEEGQVRLIFPHWRSGTLPLSTRIRHLFPTAYETPRIRFMLVDGDTGDKFPGWVEREKGYIYGLEGWYDGRGVMPGSIIRVRKGNNTGEVIIWMDNRRSSREWIRTVLVGSDGGVVFAMLKQIVETPYDERMAIAVPDKDALDQVWQHMQKEQPPFERVVVNMVREMAKLNPQSHVHASELYAAINVVRRCPPAPILTLLASRPWFIHVGDLHYRLSDTEYD